MTSILCTKPPAGINQSFQKIACTIRMISVSVAFILFVAAAPRALASGSMSEDNEIRKALQEYLEVEIPAAKDAVSVDVQNGVVMLTGTVENLLQKSQARQVAESVRGVRSVIDDTRVAPSMRDDDAISGDIRSNLKQILSRHGMEVTVAVNRGVVTLTGRVDSWVLSRMAARKAKSVIGVTEVDNRIHVNPGPHRDDQAIRKDVMRRLENDLYVDAGRIEVTVKDGSVILSGTVPTVADKRRAEADAWITGVTEVRSRELEVKWSGKDRRRQAPYIPQSDEDIHAAVEDALRLDPRINPDIPQVVVANGSVTLSGALDTLYAKQAAVEDARSTTGVWRVNDQLQFRYRSFPLDAEVKHLVEDVFRRDAELHDQDISVAVKNNRVRLTGTVESMGQKVRAENIVSQIEGVLTVDNRIKVAASPPHQASDADISAAINDELYWSPYVDSDRLTVTVEDGQATLKGRAADRFVVRIAVQNAFEGGARSVRTHLILNDGGIVDNVYDEKPAPRPGAAWWLRL